MFVRAIVLAVAVLVPACGTAPTPAPAGEDEKPNVVEGKVVRAADGASCSTEVG